MSPLNQPVDTAILKSSQDTKRLCIIFIIINLVIFIGAGAMFFYYMRSTRGVDLAPVELKATSTADQLVEDMQPYAPPATSTPVIAVPTSTQ